MLCQYPLLTFSVQYIQVELLRLIEILLILCLDRPYNAMHSARVSFSINFNSLVKATKKELSLLYQQQFSIKELYKLCDPIQSSCVNMLLSRHWL